MGWASITDGRVTCAFSDNEKIEFDWNTGTNVDTKKVASNFPVDLSSYPRTLHEYTNSLLDHRVPQTDMTFRHMGSKLITVSMTLWQNKWMAVDANFLNNWARRRNIQRDISKAWVACFPSTQSCIEQIANGCHQAEEFSVLKEASGHWLGDQTNIYTHTYNYTHVYIHIYTYMCVCVYMCICVCIYICSSL